MHNSHKPTKKKLGILKVITSVLGLSSVLVITTYYAKGNNIKITITEKQPQSSIFEAINPEVTKLESRRRRWEIAQKCLRAKMAVMSGQSGRTKELCASSLDISQLIDQAGWDVAEHVINNHLESLRGYEKELKDGIIDKLPQDEPMALGALNSKIDRELQNIKDNSDSVLQETKLCLKKVRILQIQGETAIIEGHAPKYTVEQIKSKYDACNTEAERQRDSYNQRVKERQEEMEKREKAVKSFEQNYRKDP